MRFRWVLVESKARLVGIILHQSRQILLVAYSQRSGVYFAEDLTQYLTQYLARYLAQLHLPAVVNRAVTVP